MLGSICGTATNFLKPRQRNYNQKLFEFYLKYPADYYFFLFFRLRHFWVAKSLICIRFQGLNFLPSILYLVSNFCSFQGINHLSFSFPWAWTSRAKWNIFGLTHRWNCCQQMSFPVKLTPNDYQNSQWSHNSVFFNNCFEFMWKEMDGRV